MLPSVFAPGDNSDPPPTARYGLRARLEPLASDNFAERCGRFWLAGLSDAHHLLVAVVVRGSASRVLALDVAREFADACGVFDGRAHAWASTVAGSLASILSACGALSF